MISIGSQKRSYLSKCVVGKLGIMTVMGRVSRKGSEEVIVKMCELLLLRIVEIILIASSVSICYSITV